MVNLLSKSLAIAVPYALMSQSITALDLKGTVYETAGRHYQIDPLLLYSISIAESGKSSASGFVKPTPLVIRTPEGPIFSMTSLMRLALYVINALDSRALTSV